MSKFWLSLLCVLNGLTLVKSEYYWAWSHSSTFWFQFQTVTRLGSWILQMADGCGPAARTCFCPRKSESGKQVDGYRPRREEELTCKKKKKKTKTYAKEEVRSPWITTGMIEFLRWKGQEFIFLTLEPTCKCKSNRSQRPEGWLKGCGAVQKALEAWKLRCVCVCVCVCVYAHANTHQWWRIHTHSTGIYMRRLMYTYIFIQIHSVLLDFTDAVFFKLFFFLQNEGLWQLCV